MQTPPTAEQPTQTKTPATTRWPHLIENNPDRITWIARGTPTDPQMHAQPDLAPYLHLPEALVTHQESLLTESDYDPAPIQRQTGAREQEGKGQPARRDPRMRDIAMLVVIIGSFFGTLWALNKFPNLGMDLISGLSGAVAICGCGAVYLAADRWDTKKTEKRDRRVHDHNRTRDQLVADGTLVPLDDRAAGARYDAGMGEDFDRTEEYVANAEQNSDAAEVTTHVLDFWTRYWARSTAVRRELAEVDEILDTAPDRYESDAISQVRDRRETLIHDLEKAREETRTVVDADLADSGSTADAARAQQADHKAEAYLTRGRTR